MNKIILIIFNAIISLSQTHSIDDYDLYMSINTYSPDISINHVNTHDTCNISWSIINDSSYSIGIFNMFSTCYPIGLVIRMFFCLMSNYLNCHMYPNGQFGNGFIQMEILLIFFRILLHGKGIFIILLLLKII